MPPELFVARPAVPGCGRFRGIVQPCHRRRISPMASVWRRSSTRRWRAWISPRGVWRSTARNRSLRWSLRRFQDRFARWGFPPDALTPVYGLSEASLAVTFSEIDRPFSSRTFVPATLWPQKRRAVEASGGVEMVSLGRPLEGFELRVANRRTKDLLRRRVGRVLGAGTLGDGRIPRHGRGDGGGIARWLARYRRPGVPARLASSF